MTPQMKVTLSIGLALVLSRPGLAQESAAANVDTTLDRRVPLSKLPGLDVSREIWCKGGKLVDGKVVYPDCLARGLKESIARETTKSTPGGKMAILARYEYFTDACIKVEQLIDSMGAAQNENIEYKKLEGVLEKLQRQHDKAVRLCEKNHVSICKPRPPRTPVLQAP